METKIKNATPLSIAPKKIKHSVINLKKHGQNIYDENYKVLMKEIKEDLNTCSVILWLWTENST